MTSTRFPAKVLAPLCGRPIIAHVIDQLRRVRGVDRVILATSWEESDDPLAAYANLCLGADVFRGELNNVVGRFQACLKSAPCEWFVRISGDSPVIDPELVSLLLGQIGNDLDMVTNVGLRTFPAGQSVEVIRTSTFLRLKATNLDKEEQEHVTLHYYRNPWRYRIRNVKSSDPSIAKRRMVVDSLADLQALSRMLVETPEQTSGYAQFAESTS